MCGPSPKGTHPWQNMHREDLLKKEKPKRGEERLGQRKKDDGANVVREGCGTALKWKAKIEGE